MNGDDKAKTHHTPKVEISVRNFGPIAEADLDLRPLTVFVGPSNTGKTYLSVLIYVLHSVFGGFSEFPLMGIFRFLVYDLHYAPSADNIEFEKKILETLSIQNKEQPFKFLDLPQGVREQIQLRFKNFENYGEDLDTGLKRCFDLDSVSRLIRSSKDQNDKINVSLIVNDENQKSLVAQNGNL